VVEEKARANLLKTDPAADANFAPSVREIRRSPGRPPFAVGSRICGALCGIDREWVWVTLRPIVAVTNQL
jgi:hypothetical protein